MDEKKLPASQMRDGKLFVDGAKDPFVRGMIRSFTTEVSDLTYHMGYSIYDGKTQVSSRIKGTARLQNNDQIAVAGPRPKDAVQRARRDERRAPMDGTYRIPAVRLGDLRP